jgi:hypothetical protein
MDAGHKPLREIIKSNGRSGHLTAKTLKESEHREATRLLSSLSGV